MEKDGLPVQELERIIILAYKDVIELGCHIIETGPQPEACDQDSKEDQGYHPKKDSAGPRLFSPLLYQKGFLMISWFRSMVVLI